MAIKVQFEIGHSATVKSKRTPDGFTHDWELYVQGVNKADISAFVDKVVFNLHDSFPKPKRSFKEPPYVLKESGYAGFVLPIDIYFRNRDEPKRVTFSYDLDLQQEGPPVHRSEVKKYIFEAPSEDFRQKLLKGGGIAVSGVVGGAITADEKSLDMSVSDNRSQMIGKPKLSSDANSTSSSSSSKKHKQRPDDSKSNTFANLFGPPITKSAPKFSPDPKAKTANGGTGAPMAAGAAVNSKSVGGKDKANSSNSNAAGGNASTGPTVVGVKEKDKSDKKEKHKQQTSPHKEKNHEEKESRKKSEGKHDKRDEKKKEKKDKEKDRERNKEKPSKRSLSPKSAAAVAPSPKRSSPVRSSSAASRDDPSTTVKASSKSSESEKRNSGSSGGKKSKKEKKSHDKDRDHKERHRVEAKESIPVTNAVPLVPTQAIPAQAPVSSSSKAQNPTVNTKTDLNSNKNQKTSEKESKKSDSTSKAGDKEGTPLANEKKIASDKDKKSHKHKKKDKNKEKEKEKDKDQPSRKSTGSKDKKDKKEKTAKNEPATAANTGASKKSASTEAIVDTQVEGGSTKSAPSSSSSKPSKHNNSTSTVPNTNSNSNNSNNMGTTSASGLLNVINDLSDVDSLNSESLHASNSNSEKTTVMQNSDSSNSSFPELPSAQQQPKSTSLFQAPANPQPTPPLSSTPSSASSSLSSTTTIHEISRSVSASEKKDHKQHRGADKSKAEKAAEKEDKKRRRNSTAVNTFVEPPLKQIKKDFNTKTAREKSQSPLLRTEDKQTFLPPPATTSTLSAQNPPVTALNLEYLSELQELHQKIMTLQDNEELQQVVEMIAATGRYEITSKTFDFDLCKLDRNTVQRLQDFFATSVS